MSHVVRHFLRELAPQVLGAVFRRNAGRGGDFATAEDAVQDAMIAAATQWAAAGIPVRDFATSVSEVSSLDRTWHS